MGTVTVGSMARRYHVTFICSGNICRSPIACTATNATDPSDSAAITVTVAADGTPSYTFA